MSHNLNPNESQPMSIAEESLFNPQKTLHPTNQYLTELVDNVDWCVIRCVLPPGVVVPMHSHSDRETFYLLSGKLDALRIDQWEQLGPGDVFDVRDGIKHAWRNSSQEDATILCVTTTRLTKFLRKAAIPADGALPPKERAQHFLKLVESHGYWLASPEENAAVGLDVNWAGSHD
jgi:quercetin dioxygenase-like cupin family protein